MQFQVVEKSAPTAKRRAAIDVLAIERDKAIRDEGIYLLISKRDHVISHVLIRERLAERAANREARHDP